MSARMSTETAPETKPVGPGDQVLLVDGSSFIFRAYFQSINQPERYNFRPSDGLPTGRCGCSAPSSPSSCRRARPG